MILSYADVLKGVLPDYAPYIEQQFADQSERGVSVGIKRFVNSLDHKKLIRAANAIDEWKRTHIDESIVGIVEAVREGLRVKIGLKGILILSENPSVRKVNRFALKEAIGEGAKGALVQVANQVRLKPEYLEKVERVLVKLKGNERAAAFCFTLVQELVKEGECDKGLELVKTFDDKDTAKRLYDYYECVSRVRGEAHPFKEKLEESFPEFVKKEEVKPRNNYMPLIFIGTVVLSITGFAISYFLGAFVALSGMALYVFCLFNGK